MSISVIGLDTAKSVFQVHAVDETGRMVIRRKLQRNELVAFQEDGGLLGRHGSMWRCPSLGSYTDWSWT